MNNSIEPGYCIATTPGTLSMQAQQLFRRKDTDGARYFLQLNADTPYVLPGQIMIVADPSNSNQNAKLHHLRRAKNKVNHTMKFIDGDLALFMVNNHDSINSILNLSSKGIEYTSEVGSKYFKQIGNILQQIESLYQSEFTHTGKLASPQFYARRTALLAELKMLIKRPILNTLVPKTLKMKPYLKMTQALGLSTRSIIHQWSTAGAAGAIKGYAERLEASVKAVKFFKSGGYVTLALGGMMTTNDVILACSTGREHECRRAALTNYMSFAGATILSGVSASKGVLVAESICLGAGIASGGLGFAVCAAGGALAGGAIGGAGGEIIGTKMGEATNTLIGRILVD
ncbi:hypothetical protein [Serratia rhizosphaerae]|uniref:SSU ribosomal protein S2p (SAe) n=1 Tax=Serratia rhizosphaerae TaxID=2597702 RepID=A0ABX6GHU1_9GAMM|nr:hypothetical protein [Serratia rhizosphaerae]MEB6335052.1 hypothetical protein [Serratia rhizosphaerae]QHA85840.1 hypothetical protein FO014_01975 [Serratia rhizosphaerae]